MRTALFTIAAAASALAFATPASAQWYPQQPRYGHGYGYQNYGAVHRLDARTEMLRRHIYTMHRRYMLSPTQARRLDREAVQIKNRLWRSAWNGLSRSERRSIDRRLDRLERKVRYQVARSYRHDRYRPRHYGYRW